MSKLEGKVALITGGGSGIGLASARLFLREGARVAITGRGTARLEEATRELAAGERLLAHPTDVTIPEQVEELIRLTQERLGPIDILVNNAGANIKERTFLELTPERWRQLLGANLDGAFLCIRQVLPHMLQRGTGTIIQVNSISGKRASPLGGPAYAAAKFGLRGLAMAVAGEVQGKGVRFTSIYPGEVNTPILEARPSPVTEEHRQSILQPEDVAEAVLFTAALPAHVAIPEMIITPARTLYI